MQSLQEAAVSQAPAMRVPGGSAANVLKGLAGVSGGTLQCQFVGMVGSDEAGAFYAQQLRSHGVEPLLLVRAPWACPVGMLGNNWRWGASVVHAATVNALCAPSRKSNAAITPPATSDVIKRRPNSTLPVPGHPRRAAHHADLPWCGSGADGRGTAHGRPRIARAAALRRLCPLQVYPRPWCHGGRQACGGAGVPGPGQL